MLQRYGVLRGMPVRLQIFTVLSPVFSEVVDLTLGYSEHVSSPEWHYEADRTQWRNLLRSSHSVKTLLVDEGLTTVTRKLSRSLRPAEGESPVESLPDLKELKYSTYRSASDAFSSFIDAPQLAGRPVTLVRRRKRKIKESKKRCILTDSSHRTLTNYFATFHAFIHLHNHKKG